MQTLLLQQQAIRAAEKTSSRELLLMEQSRLGTQERVISETSTALLQRSDYAKVEIQEDEDQHEPLKPIVTARRKQNLNSSCATTQDNQSKNSFE